MKNLTNDAMALELQQEIRFTCLVQSIKGLARVSNILSFTQNRKVSDSFSFIYYEKVLLRRPLGQRV